MKIMKHNPHPIDQKDFYQGQFVLGGRDFHEGEPEEEFTDGPLAAPTFRSHLLRLRKSVSDKLFSIEFGKISF